MTAFLTTSIITFVLFGAAVLIINFCKARAAINTKHELTGMCHRSGGVSCCSSMANLSSTTTCSKSTERKGEENNNHAG